MKKQLLYLFTAICLAVSFTSCDKGDDPKDPGNTDTFTDYDKEKLNQEIFADQTGAASGFAFTAKEAWSISIGDLAKSTTDNSWVKVDPMNGGVGTHTINIELDLNYTGEDRIAEINIKAGESKITITVEQKGTTADNEKPTLKLIKSVKVDYVYHDENATKESDMYTFDYDSNGKAKKIVIKGSYTTLHSSQPGDPITPEKTVKYTEIYDVTYPNNQIVETYTYTDDDDGEANNVNMVVTYELNSKEMVTSCVAMKKALKSMSSVLHYNIDGYVDQSVNTYYESEKKTVLPIISINDLTWTKGNLTRVGGDDDYLYSTATYGEYDNKTNLNLNSLLYQTESMWFANVATEEGDIRLASLISRSGKTSAKLVKEEIQIHASKESEKYQFKYTFDDSGYPITVKVTTDNNPDSELKLDATYTITYDK